MSKCRGCGAEIEWLRMKSGKVMPVDPEPVFVKGGRKPGVHHGRGGNHYRNRCGGKHWGGRVCAALGHLPGGGPVQKERMTNEEFFRGSSQCAGDDPDSGGAGGLGGGADPGWPGAAETVRHLSVPLRRRSV